jgi:hypothetical protein
MRRFTLASAVALLLSCSPDYKSGSTECSTDGKCPKGFICGGASTRGALDVCYSQTEAQCGASAGYYCPASSSCWSSAVACDTVVNCGTGHFSACPLEGYAADCSGSNKCTWVGGIGGGSGGAGGKLGTGGAGGGSGGGTGGSIACGASPIAAICQAEINAATDSCKTCIPTNCCSQLAACVNDMTCLTTYAGPVFDTLGECTVSCCSEACSGVGGQGGSTGGGAGTTGGRDAGAGSAGQGGSRDGAVDVRVDGFASRGDGPVSPDGRAGGAGGLGGSGGGGAGGSNACVATPVTTVCQAMISSTTDACTICTESNCCSQVIACVNDTVCTTTYTGPLWDAYTSCITSCCTAACSGGGTDAGAPDTRVPDARVPDVRVPDAQIPDARVPDVRVADAYMSEVRPPDAGVYACGPAAVYDTTNCLTSYPYWCAATQTCWDMSVDCWTAVDCDTNGIIDGGCNCGYHFNCATQQCQALSAPPACIPAVYDTYNCSSAYPYYCSVMDMCWSAPTDCGNTADCDSDGTLDTSCGCGKHMDCTKLISARCPSW